MSKSQLVDSNGRAANEDVQLVSPTGAPLGKSDPQPEQLQLVPFDDGYIYKFSDNPARKGTYIMHTVDGNVVAVLPDPRVANLLCEAMRMLNLANQQVQVTEGDAVPEFAKDKANADGPGEEDGPWAEGYKERAGVSQPVVFES